MLLPALWAMHAVPCPAQPSMEDSLAQAIQEARTDTAQLAAMLALSEHIVLTAPDSNRVLCLQIMQRLHAILDKKESSPAEHHTLLRMHGEAVNNLGVSHFLTGDLDSALLRFEQAFDVHLDNGYDEGMGDALNNMGVVLEAMGDHTGQRRKLFEALARYQLNNDQMRSGKVLNNLGNYYMGRGMPDSAYTYLDSAWHTFEKIGDQQSAAQARLNLGRWYDESGMPARALEHYLMALPVFEATGHPREQAICHNNIGAALMDQAIWPQALAHYHKSLDIHVAHGDLLGEATARQNIGAVLDQIEEWDLALEQYLLAQAIYSSHGDKRGEAALHGHIGNVYKNQGDMDKAEVHLRTALASSRAVDDPDGTSTALYKLGHHLHDVGRPAEAMPLFHESLQIEQRSGRPRGEASAYFGMAQTELSRGDLVQAELHARKALATSESIDDALSAMRATQILHQALADQGKWAAALRTLEQHEQLKDTVNNVESVRKTVRRQVRYELDKKLLADSLGHLAERAHLHTMQQIYELRATQARNKAWVVAASCLILLAGGLGIYRLDRSRHQVQGDRDAAILHTRVLRTQMNPHFIFNILISIDQYLQENEHEIATGLLKKFKRSVELVLDNSLHDEVTLACELETLGLYMDLEAVRMNGKLRHSIEVDPAIDTSTVMLPPLILQPFVENAIKHGISTKEGPGRISISIQRQGKMLAMAVEDDGVGRMTSPQRPSLEPLKRSSLGTRITEERLALFGKQHGAEGWFLYMDVPMGTRVELTLPYVGKRQAP